MKIILREDVDKLGRIGDVVQVAAGYGRNYLIPRNIAIAATPGNLKVVELERQARARKDHREKEAASRVAQEMAEMIVKLQRKSGEEGTLYGSVTAQDIADHLVAHKIDIDKRKVQLDDPIKAIGDYEVSIRLHREVVVPIKVVVEPEPDPSSE